MSLMSISSDSLLQVGTVLGLLLTGAYTAFQSWRANKQTKSTGNGFAGHVMDGISELRTDLAEVKAAGLRTEAKIDAHMGDHAAADVYRVRRIAP